MKYLKMLSIILIGATCVYSVKTEAMTVAEAQVVLKTIGAKKTRTAAEIEELKKAIQVVSGGWANPARSKRLKSVKKS